MRGPPAEHGNDVADHRTGGRADNADTPRVSGQGALAGGVEQAFGIELFFQRLEGQAQRAITGRFDVVEDQLIVAAALEQGHPPAHLDRQAITQRLAYTQGVLSEECAADL